MTTTTAATISMAEKFVDLTAEEAMREHQFIENHVAQFEKRLRSTTALIAMGKAIHDFTKTSDLDVTACRIVLAEGFFHLARSLSALLKELEQKPQVQEYEGIDPGKIQSDLDWLQDFVRTSATEAVDWSRTRHRELLARFEQTDIVSPVPDLETLGRARFAPLPE